MSARIVDNVRRTFLYIMVLDKLNLRTFRKEDGGQEKEDRGLG
jgi:hypothetical protein